MTQAKARMTAKHKLGTSIAYCMEEKPEIRPMTGGAAAPPIIAITRKDAPDLVSGPRSRIAPGSCPRCH